MDIIPKHDQWTSDVETPRPERMPLSSQLAVAVGVVGPFLGLIAAVAWAWTHGGMGWVDVWLLVGMYSLTVIGVTVGFHRLFTHKSFETNVVVRVLLAIFGSMSIQGPVIKWCAVHRRHHQESDLEGDPHSPHLHGDSFWGMLVGMWHAHVGWIFEPDPENIKRSVKDLVADKWLMWVNNWFAVWVALGMIIPAALGYVLTGTVWGAFTGLLWGGLARAFLMHHVTWSINSVCHVWGTRPFDSQDHSRNNFPIAIISFGEGWHNNHHAFPTSARHGLKWWQIDISYIFITGMKWVGLARNVRVPNEKALEAKRRKVAAKEQAAGGLSAAVNNVIGTGASDMA